MYKVLKSFTPEDFYRAALKDHGIDWKCQEFDGDMAWFSAYAGSMFQQIAFTEVHGALFAYMDSHANFERDLIKYGFIEKVKPKREVKYKMVEKSNLYEVMVNDYIVAVFFKDGSGMRICDFVGEYAYIDTVDGHIKHWY